MIPDDRPTRALPPAAPTPSGDGVLPPPTTPLPAPAARGLAFPARKGGEPGGGVPRGEEREREAAGEEEEA